MNKKLCLVCSGGGHFYLLYSLKEFWMSHNRFWVSFLGKDNTALLSEERYYNAYHPTNRNIKNLIKNIFLAYKILRKEKPDFIISTGAGVGVPFIYIGKMLGIKTIYIEALTRIKELSLTALLIYPVVNHLFVQWPELAKKYRKTEFVGQIL